MKRESSQKQGYQYPLATAVISRLQFTQGLCWAKKQMMSNNSFSLDWPLEQANSKAYEKKNNLWLTIKHYLHQLFINAHLLAMKFCYKMGPVFWRLHSQICGFKWNKSLIHWCRSLILTKNNFIIFSKTIHHQLLWSSYFPITYPISSRKCSRVLENSYLDKY